MSLYTGTEGVSASANPQNLLRVLTRGPNMLKYIYRALGFLFLSHSPSYPPPRGHEARPHDSTTASEGPRPRDLDPKSRFSATAWAPDGRPSPPPPSELHRRRPHGPRPAGGSPVRGEWQLRHPAGDWDVELK
jgi:hypothetical protein